MGEVKDDSDVGKEFYAAALRICAGEFQIPAVEVELAARERKALRCQAKVEDLQLQQESHSSSSGFSGAALPGGAALTGAAGVFAGGMLKQKGAGQREAEYNQLKAKLEEVRKKKTECEAQAVLLKKQVAQIRDDVRRSRAKIHGVLYKKKASDKNYSAIKRAKRELLALATEVNPQAANAVVKLGLLFARTPAFLFQLGIVEDGFGKRATLGLGERGAGAEDYTEDDVLMRLPDDSVLAESFAGETWDTFERIDGLAQKAEAQCATSIVTLLGMLAAPEQYPQVTQHLIRTIVDKADLVQRKDAMATRGPSEACVVTVNWPAADPKTGEMRSTTNLAQYRKLLAWADREYDEACRQHRQSLPSGQEAEADPGVSREEVLELSKEKITRDFSAEAGKEAGFLHQTPLVCDVLIKVAQRGYDVIMLEHTVLYGHKSDTVKEEHWFFRRRAAGRICELALQGSEMAQRMMADELLVDEHWMVRALVVSEACQLLGVMDPSASPRALDLFDDLARAVVHNVYLAPKQSSHGETEDEVEMRLTTQRAAEVALVKEMRKFPPDIYKHVHSELFKQREANPEVNKPVFKRVVDSIGQNKGARTAAPGPASAKKMREVQAELIHNEDRQRSTGA